MNAKKLLWGEHHLYGNYYTIKICIGAQLKDLIKDDLKKHNIDLDIYQAINSKLGKERFIIAGVIKHLEYLKYSEIKNRCQAALLIRKATYHIDVSNNRFNSHVNVKKYEESINLNDPENLGLSV